MPALFLGSIGVLAETSHLQREAFNAAFAEAGLDWTWSEDAYKEMLKDSGGRDRIARYAAERGEDVDADALHARKSALFQEKLEKGVPLRPGVDATITEAVAQGWKVALVTATSPENVVGILNATGLAPARFDLVLDRQSVETGKPDPEIYRLALSRLGMDPEEVLAVEDNPDGLAAAHGAEIGCIAFPGAYHDKSDFTGARAVVETLTLHPIEAE